MFHQVDDIFLFSNIEDSTFLPKNEEQSLVSKGFSFIKTFFSKYDKLSANKIYAVVFKIYLSLLEQEFLNQGHNLNSSMFIRGLHSGFYGAYSMTSKKQYSWCKITDKQPIIVCI